MNTNENDQSPETKDKPNVGSVLGVPILRAVVGRVFQKVRFADKEAASTGFFVLLKSGGMEGFGDNVYGLSSPKQIQALEDSKIPYEVVK